MAEFSNTPQFVGMEQFYKEYKTYGNRNFTSGENGIAEMERRDIDNAQKAIAAQDKKFGILLQEKINELMIPARVRQEMKEVAIKTVSVAFQQWLDWYEDNSIVFDEERFNSEIQANAKQLFYTKHALAREASEEKVGQQFYASY